MGIQSEYMYTEHQNGGKAAHRINEWSVPKMPQVELSSSPEAGAFKTLHIPEHAKAFASVLRLAAERIERGESVQDVVRGMALHNVVLALSGLV